MTASNNASAHASATPAAAQPPPGKRRTEVVIVGAGDELLIEVGPALGDQFRTFSADTAAEIADSAVTSWIGVYDATAQAAGRSAFAQLESQYGKQPWIVLCADEDRSNWRDVLSRGGACAVIARGEISVAPSRPRSPRRRNASRSQSPGSARHIRPPNSKDPWCGSCAAVIVVAAGAGWWMSHSHIRARPAARHRDKRASPAQQQPRRSPGGGPCGPAGRADRAASVEDLLSHGTGRLPRSRRAAAQARRARCRELPPWNCMARYCCSSPRMTKPWMACAGCSPWPACAYRMPLRQAMRTRPRGCWPSCSTPTLPPKNCARCRPRSRRPGSSSSPHRPEPPWRPATFRTPISSLISW